MRLKKCCQLALIMGMPVLAVPEELGVPLVNAASSDDATVTGQAAPGSAPITVYDLSYPVRTALGSGKSMDDNGFFAVSVSPPLIAGHQIVAEDAQGRVGAPVTVEEPPVDDATGAGGP